MHLLRSACRPLALLGFALLIASCAARANQRENDPLEPLNRKVFWFNDVADRYVIEPAARGWDFIIPKPAQRCIANVFDNLRYPVNFANTLLQGRFEQTAITSGRFTLNSSVGLLGLFDPATHFGIPKPETDMGQTFGVWGIPAGPYLVLPLFGPSSLRDTLGMPGDGALQVYGFLVPLYASIAVKAVEVVNFRAGVIEDIRSARKASLDYYAFVRNAYIQRRKALIRGEGTIEAPGTEDLYEIEEYDEE